MAHFIVFALACRRLPGDLNVSHSLHTPLMAVTNVISGMVVWAHCCRSAPATGWSPAWRQFRSIAAINIVGGFLVTRRMLAMFQKS